MMEFSRLVSGLETVSRHIFESLVSVSPRTWSSSLDLESWSRKVMVSKYEKSWDSKSWLGVGVKFWIYLFNASNANKDSIDFLGLNTFLIAFQQSSLFILVNFHLFPSMFLNWDHEKQRFIIKPQF